MGLVARMMRVGVYACDLCVCVRFQCNECTMDEQIETVVKDSSALVVVRARKCVWKCVRVE